MYYKIKSCTLIGTPHTTKQHAWVISPLVLNLGNDRPPSAKFLDAYIKIVQSKSYPLINHNHSNISYYTTPATGKVMVNNTTNTHSINTKKKI